MVAIRKVLISASLFLVAVGASRAQLPSYLAPPPLAPELVGPSTLEDRNDSILVGNPLLDPRNNLGWFATVDIGLDGSHVHNELNATFGVGGKTATVALPTANLDWTVSPRFEAGYRLGQGAGEIVVSYRFLCTSGTQTTPAFDAAGNAGSLHSQLAMNVIDIDYANQEFALAPWFDMKWRVGVRISTMFFDSAESSPLLQQHESNYFVGAGPHAALDLWFPAEHGFAGFLKIDGAGVFGKVQQEFEETLAGVGSGALTQTGSTEASILNVQAGFSWAPSEAWRFTFGYTYEHWWDTAFTSLNNSHGDVWTQGVFFRGEWKY